MKQPSPSAGDSLAIGRDTDGGSLWPFVVLAIVHLLGCLVHLPPGEIFSGEPVLTSDYSNHFLEAARVSRHYREGSIWGYSTTWAAGQPEGFVSAVNNKPFCIVLALLPDALHPLAFNLTLLVALWIVPVLLHATARRLGADRYEASAAMLLAMLAWYGSGLFRLFWRGGSVLFLVGVAFALYAVAMLHARWTRSAPLPSRTRLALAFAIVPWIHPLAAIVAILGASVSWGITLRQGWRLADVVTIAMTVLLANLPWLAPFVAIAELRTTYDHGIYLAGWSELSFDLFRGALHVTRKVPKEEVAVLAPLLLAALAARRRGPATDLLWILSLGLGALTYATSAVASVMQPYRFALPLTLTVALLGGPALARAASRNAPPLFRGILVLVLLLCVDRVRIAAWTRDFLGTGPSTRDRWAFEILRSARSDTPGSSSGRILAEGDWIVETVDRWFPSRRIDYSFVALERYLEGAELLGAPIMNVGVPQEIASFWQGTFLGKPIESYDREAFRQACELYDIRFILTIRESTYRHVASLAPVVREIASRHGIGIFVVARERDRVVRGTGTATSDGRRIRFESPDGEAAVLSFHWIPQLKASGGAQLTPAEPWPGAPIRFVRIVPPGPGIYEIDDP